MAGPIAHPGTPAPASTGAPRIVIPRREDRSFSLPRLRSAPAPACKIGPLIPVRTSLTSPLFLRSSLDEALTSFSACPMDALDDARDPHRPDLHNSPLAPSWLVRVSLFFLPSRSDHPAYPGPRRHAAA
jgi:hypothetical protein